MAYMNNRVFGLADGRFVYGTRPGRYLSVMKADGTTIKVLSKIYDIFPQFVEKNHNIRYVQEQHKGINIKVSGCMWLYIRTGKQAMMITRDFRCPISMR